MRRKFLLPILVVLLSSTSEGFAQKISARTHSDIDIIDSLVARGMVKGEAVRHPDILLSRDQAISFLQRTMSFQSWKNLNDPLRSSIRQLIFEAEKPPFDSAAYYLRQYPYDSITVAWDEFYIWKPMQFYYYENPLTVTNKDLFKAYRDTVGTDSVKLGNMGPDSLRRGTLKDTTIMVIVDTLREVKSSYPEFPFRYYRYPYQSDSIRAAVGTVLDYLESRDSSMIRITGTGTRGYSLWINSKSDRTLRFWLRNDLNDSVTVWIDNPARNTIGLYLENGVSFKRPSRQGNVSKARINVEPQDNVTLRNIQKIITKQQFWKTHTEASFILNQAFLTNWVKGGESSISTALDITWFADYNNKPMLLSSSHFARIKYGLVASVTDGIRKNLDLLETNSKLNHKAFGKFDFSGIMLFKTQVSKGYNYPNDSVPVSKFFNPAILTLGLGLDYKPDRLTSINFSPFSYKATFVPDTATIDQTKYGVPSNRRSMHEPGASLLISNEFRPLKSVAVTNRLQFFTNYINNPQNIDVDWELILKASLNWFTEVRLNTHLIYDDDTKTPVFDSENNPVTGNDGLQKKAARIQFKELVGFSFVFRF